MYSKDREQERANERKETCETLCLYNVHMNFAWRLCDMNKVIVDQLSFTLSEESRFFCKCFFLFVCHLFSFLTPKIDTSSIYVSEGHADVCVVFFCHKLIFNIFFEIPSLHTWYCVSHAHYALMGFLPALSKELSIEFIFLASFILATESNSSFIFNSYWNDEIKVEREFFIGHLSFAMKTPTK